MSKYSTVRANITDAELLRTALEEACAQFGVQFEQGKNLVLRGFSRQVDGAHFAVRKYQISRAIAHTWGDLGFVWNAERGAYDLIVDDEYGKLTGFVTAIQQSYVKHNTIRVMATKGYEPVVNEVKDGKVRLEFRSTRRAARKAKAKPRLRVRIGGRR